MIFTLVQPLIAPPAAGLCRRFSSGIASPITLYVDSVAGSDANSGRSAAAAKQTLAAARTLAVSGEIIGLARGSSWREMFEVRQAGTAGTFVASFMPYGSGDPPQISGADIIAPNLFTVSGHADAAGVTYEYAWTRGAGFQDGVDQVMLWENDTRLYRRTSVALVAANPGSYYAPGEEANSSTIYIRPYGSTDPRSDGKSYEVTKRGAGIECYASGCAGSSVTGPIHVLRGWEHIGSMAGPWKGGTASNILIGGSGLHHMGTSVAESEDVVIYDIAKNYGTGFFPYVAFLTNGLGFTHKAKRVISHGDSGADAVSKAFNGGFYSHGVSNGYDVVTYEQCAQTYAGKGFSSTNPELRVLGCYTRDTSQAVVASDNSTITIKHLMAHNNSSKGIIFDGPAELVAATRLVENCVLVMNSSGAQGIMALARSGSLTLRNCVIIGDFSRALETTTTSSVTGSMVIVVERCIFVRTATAQTIFYPRIGTGSYTGTNNIFWTLSAGSEAGAATFNNGGSNMNFAAWKAAGNDVNSLAFGTYNGKSLLTSIFVEDPRTNGNFTLRTDTGIVFGDGAALTTVGPQEYWDWNTRAVVAGPPTAYPTLPTTLTDMKSYITDPTVWDFYP